MNGIEAGLVLTLIILKYLEGPSGWVQVGEVLGNLREPWGVLEKIRSLGGY